MTIDEWIHQREIRGYMTFSVLELRQAFPANSEKGMKTALRRLSSKGRIQSVYRGFYVVIPIQYQLQGIVPPNYYIDELMAYVGKPYYIGLLSAAAKIGGDGSGDHSVFIPIAYPFFHIVTCWTVQR